MRGLSIFENGANLAEFLESNSPEHRLVCRMSQLSLARALSNQKNEEAFFKATLRTINSLLDEDNAEATWKRNKANWMKKLEGEVWQDVELFAETLSTKTYACKLASFPFDVDKNKYVKNKNIYYKLLLCILKDGGTTKRKRGASEEGRDASRVETALSKRVRTSPPSPPPGPAETQAAVSNPRTRIDSALSAIACVRNDTVLHSYLASASEINTQYLLPPAHHFMPGMWKTQIEGATDWYISMYCNRMWYTQDITVEQTLVLRPGEAWGISGKVRGPWHVVLFAGQADAICSIVVSHDHELLPFVAEIEDVH
ncbi:hypothetical protein E8E12_003104 [Didymella heteroderae]|uniref:Uncharacterized protein n=1 Tax=Didymella heteroderae TaxID=1769908 RepID=A0A9P4WGM2_9PLEO|nr:hypothetical protein E8E12_003104 [Didymella heteroderae]